MIGYIYDDDGYYERWLTLLSPKGSVVIPPNCSTACPWGDGAEDQSVFYRLVDGAWTVVKKPSCAAEAVGTVVSHTSTTAHDVEMRALIQKFAQEEGFREVRGEDLSWSVAAIPEKTETELALEEKRRALEEAKRNLANTDYVAAKIAEGVATKEEYADVLAQRAAWREEVNTLTAAVAALEA